MPVLIIGIAISILLPAHLSPKVLTIISSRNDALLDNAIRSAVSICEERFKDLLDLRMESNSEMRSASLNQAIEEIKGIHMESKDIHMLVVSRDAKVLGTTLANAAIQPKVLLEMSWHDDERRLVGMDQLRYHMVHRYFPFWKIHIYGMITQADYMAPIQLAKRIVYLGTFGVLLSVLIVLILLFNRQVNLPLKTLIRATRTVKTEHPQKIIVKRKDEIAELALAFNVMVDHLIEDKRQIREMMGELRDSEEQYRILSEYSLTHIAMIRKDQILFLNQTMAQAAGLDDQPIGQLRFHELIDLEDRQMVLERLSALESGQRKSDRFECRLKSLDKTTIWLDALATLALYQETHAVLFHAVDITERKGLEKKLSQAQKLEAIGTLAGGVAHDLNNILSSLLGYPELLLLDLPPDSRLRRPLTQIQSSAQRAAEIVQDLLTMARRGVDVEQVLNLNQIVGDYLLSLEHQRILESHPHITFETDLDELLLNLQGSSVHLTKSLMNLVRNAAESISEPGKVVITTTNQYIESKEHTPDAIPQGDYVVLTVEDSGTGISKEDMEHIFEPFYTKKVMGHSGTGLGMSVVLGTVQDHRGKVEVSSREDCGTRFSLYFPATREASNAHTCNISFEDYSGNGEKILVVDDVEDQRNLMMEMLGRFGYQVDAVESGEAALAFVQTERVDLLLLDMVMDPGIDGLETLRQILEIEPDQKAILLSGFSENERVKAALKLGAETYLKKPVVMEQLGMAIRSTLCTVGPADVAAGKSKASY